MTEAIASGDPPPRHSYQVVAPQEQYIVPLLREEITRAIECYSPPSGDALDIGCGRQPFRSLIERQGLRYFGFDRADSGSNNLDFTGSIDAPLIAPLIEHRFSLIICTEVLEHVFEWTTAFANIATLLEPGGCAVVTVPHLYPIHEEPLDYWRPTSLALKLHADHAALEVAAVERVGDGWDVIGTVVATTDPRWRGGFGQAPWLLFTRVCRLAVLRIASSRYLRERVDLNSPLYLSNVAVLRRPVG